MDQILSKVLIVDDNEAVRFGLREHLDAIGFLCLEAENGLQALAIMKTHHVKILLTDFNMPLMDGMQLARTLLQEPSYETPFVILMSGEPTEDIRRMAAKAGVQAVLDKPFTIEDFGRVLRDCHDHVPQAA